MPSPEVDRAAENLAKSGKSFGVPGTGRRDSMPVIAGRPYSEYGKITPKKSERFSSNF
jgi:hypothetical protein